ncbi:MAG: PHP domain-containing protein [Anaerolineaceae bacterium]|nr:PHP domain-containing protein [Anaerolineaceae bacterium]
MAPNKKSGRQNTSGTVLIKKEIVIPADFSDPYLDIYFDVPKHARKVGVRSSHHRKNSFPWIYLSLFDPFDFRGSQLQYLISGVIVYDLWVSKESSAFGCIPGEIPDGKWRIQFDIRFLHGPEKVSVEMYYETGASAGVQPTPFFDERITNKNPGWYKGELHAHTKESDGKLTVSELIGYAHSSQLDFLSITDHFTVSQWWRITPSDLTDMVLINSSEITSHRGHANIHGIRKWVDVYTDRENWNVNLAAEETHQQGGLFCINHAFNTVLGWRQFDFNWENADLFEIFHSTEGPNNIAQISMWDTLLREGHRIIGVAGTDCHNPENEIEKLGRVVTWVHADELSAKGIIEGLIKGNVFVSLGPKMEFSIKNSSGSTASMGEKINSNGQPLEISICVESPEIFRILLVKNGFFLDSKIFKPGKEKIQIIKFMDDIPCHGYYRVEFHKITDEKIYKFVEWRDFRTIRALSNPIWVD